MKTKHIISFVLVLFFSCSASKTKTRKQTDTNTIRDISETETIKSTRKGDTLTYTVLNPVLKDTVIYFKDTQKVGSNTLRISYDTSGKQTIDCISDEINELKETIRSISEQEAKKETTQTKEKESIINGRVIVYVFLGLAFLMVVNKLMNKIT